MLIDKQGKQPGQGQDKHSDPPQVKMMCEKQDLNNIVRMSHGWMEETILCLMFDLHGMLIMLYK